MGDGSEDPKAILFDAMDGDRPLSWLDVDVSDLSLDEKIKSSAVLRQLQSVVHPYIERVRASGLSRADGKLVMITDRLSAYDTVEDYLAGHGPVPLAFAQQWCTQVVHALCLLHSCEPPIVHMALRCTHLMLHGNDPRICKVSGFAWPRLDEEQRKAVAFVAYIPPELYDKADVTPKVDIYALGMCALHMLTGEQPYEECKHAAEVYKRVEDGIRPKALEQIRDADARSFVEVCLQNAEVRPAAADLLSHEFVKNSGLLPPKVALSGGRIKDPMPPHTTTSSPRLQLCLTFSIKGKHKEIAFPFHREKDTPHGIASEMVSDVPLLAEGGQQLSDAIRDTILRLLRELSQQ